MFHYGSILNKVSSPILNDLIAEKDLNSDSLLLNSEIQTIVKKSESVKTDNYKSDLNNVSDLDLLQNKNNLIDNSSILNEVKNSVVVRCSCSVCCGEPLAAELELELANSTINSAPTAAASISQAQIDTLLTGRKWSGNTITYSFYEDSVFNGSYYGPESGVREVSAKVKSNVREILNLVESFIDIDFVEVAETNTSTYGQIRYMLSNDPNYAYAYLPYGGARSGDVHLNPGYDNASNINGFQNNPGKHGYVTLIHETFHALGLEHPFDDRDGDALDAAKDNYSTTVMTYDFKGNSPGTAMPLDIAALQYLYGAAENNSGNDTYVFGSTTDVFRVNGQSPLTTSHRIKQTIWDSSGTDTLDFSGLSLQNGGYLFDLNEGGWLVANAQNKVASGGEKYYNYGTSLAYDVTIENVVNSRSSDNIIANDAANTFAGYRPGTSVGNDILRNTDNLDTLDLSDYRASDVAQSQNGNDLLINLGSDGSVTVKNYYAASNNNRLNISFAPEDPVVTEDPDVTEDPVTESFAIAEVGKITTLDHTEKTIQLQNDYTNPVVFAQPLSYNGADPAIVRITDINSDSDTVTFKVQEPEYRNVFHVEESFSYIVVEEGAWQLANGAVLEVGQVNTDEVTSSGWEQVQYSHSFTEKPVVLTQVQTDNEAQFVRTRQKDRDRDGFAVSLEEEEIFRYSTHAEETVGWLAMSSGTGEWDEISYKAASTADVVTHNWHELDFSGFDSTPNLLASIATFDGGDASGLRYRDITGSNTNSIEIKVEEDQSKDSEIKHTTEVVDFFALEGSGILTAQPYDPSAAQISAEAMFDVATETDFI